MTATLRPMIAADKWQVLQWRNRDHVRAFMYDDQPISRDTHHVWFQSALADPARKCWIIQAEGNDVGLVSLHDLDPASGSGDFAIYIGDAGLAGRGIGGAALAAILAHAFEDLKLNTLCCEALCSNAPARTLYRKLGFIEIAALPGRCLRDGEPVDAVRYALSRAEWASRRAATGTSPS